MTEEAAPNSTDGEPPAERRNELVVPILVAAYVAGYFIQVRKLPIAATLYPFLLMGAVTLGLLAILFTQRKLLRQSLAQLGRHAGPPTAAARQGWILFALFLTACAAYPVVAVKFGFTFATLAFVWVLLRGFGEKSWLRALLIAVATSIGFLFAIGWLVGIPLPRFSYATLPFGI